MNTSSLLESICLQLYDIGCFKFGQFTLKSGASSPIYVDLRTIVSHPTILKLLSACLYQKMQSVYSSFENKRFKLLGVPYSALTFAVTLATEHNFPLLLVRKEGAKEYGTKQAIEGLQQEDLQQDLHVAILEDVVTSGASILETVQKLQTNFTDRSKLHLQAFVFLDRQQGGIQNLSSEHSIPTHAVVTLHQLCSILLKYNKIDESMMKTIENYLQSTQTTIQKPVSVITTPKMIHKSFSERATLTKSPMAKKIFELMERKQSNLALAADLTDPSQILKIIEQVGPYICVLKTHVDIWNHFDMQIITQLQELSQKFDFLIFEDRKFADIGKVVQTQYAGGVYNIANWSHITNCHLISGASSVVKGLKQVVQEKQLLQERGLLLIAKMSTVDTTTNQDTEALALQVAQEQSDFVSGFICQGRLHSSNSSILLDQFVYCTPGVNSSTAGDQLGQNYNTPEYIVEQKGSDMIIVGTGIYGSKDPITAAKEYKTRGWNAYLNRMQNK